jgi:hypothetical protein
MDSAGKLRRNIVFAAQRQQFVVAWDRGRVEHTPRTLAAGPSLQERFYRAKIRRPAASCLLPSTISSAS